MTTHQCSVDGCRERVPDARLMCYRHWQGVPVVLQKMIYRLWNNGKALPGHAEACASAVDQVNNAIKERAA